MFLGEPFSQENGQEANRLVFTNSYAKNNTQTFRLTCARLMSRRCVRLEQRSNSAKKYMNDNNRDKHHSKQVMKHHSE